MAEVTLQVAGRSYRLACRDGEEQALQAAGQAVDSRATALARTLGAVPESRLLLMTALSFAGGTTAQPGTDPAPLLDSIAEQLESLAARLEDMARTT